MGRIERMPWRGASGALRLFGPDGLVASRLDVATTPRARLKGLLGREGIGDDEALLLRPCAQVHTFGMRFGIDAVFCDADLDVLSVVTLEPGRMSRRVRGAALCIELGSGRAAECGIVPGVRLDVRDGRS